MELVATAQFRRAMERAVAAKAYADRLARLARNLSNADADVSHPLLEKRDATRRAALFVLTANRGMCGGYNASVLREGTARFEELKREYDEVELFVSGKRGISYLKYRRIEIARSFDQFDHRPTFADVAVLANECLARYVAGELDRIDVAYSKFVSLSRQTPTAETLLPFASASADDAEDDAAESAIEYEFLPSPQSILEEVAPSAFKMKLFKCFLDAAVSEQIARMMAMKAATDNADQMISSLTTTYNRARQSQITNEIIEVVSGASALQ